LDGQNGELTALLIRWSDGDRSSIDGLFPLIQNELHRIAARYMRRESQNHVLQATALVNEAYLKLVDQDRTSWKDRAHFFAIAAKLMRRILMDEARRGHREKRGGMCAHVPLDENAALAPAPGNDADILALDEALTKLAGMDERKAKVVELRYFGGLDVKEVSAVLDVSEETVARDWRLAKVWLKRELERKNAAAC
jgi:RNA polymerase sigma factor (TIGR02999 family)